ncbi:MAG: HupE/UreJ family protein, partial [Myxococcota bacterium]
AARPLRRAHAGRGRMSARRALGFVAFCVLGTFATARANAHPLAPSLLELHEGVGGVELVFRTPLARASGANLVPILPEGCVVVGSPEVERDDRAETSRAQLDCGAAPLAGRELGVAGLRESATNVLVRVELADGTRAQSVLDADRARFTVPARASRSETLRAYLGLGVRHILGGFDHLLFVAGLVLLVTGARALFATVTAFTLGHAITLSCAALGLVHLPVGAVEVAIAGSVFWLALELAERRGSPRRPARMAASFGLLHGFGFAAALSEAGLPSVDVPLALAGFNAGIELGQLAVVAVLLLFVRALRRYERPLAYTFGTLAAFWLIERTLAVL